MTSTSTSTARPAVVAAQPIDWQSVAVRIAQDDGGYNRLSTRERDALEDAIDLADATTHPLTPGGFPYQQAPHRYCGNDNDRASVGDPGHCEDCASVGHIAAHPDLGCGDVGCDADHPEDQGRPYQPRRTA